DLLQRVDEAIRLRVARDCGGLGDLEADARAVEAAALELVDDERQELLVRQALARQVDRAQRQPLALVGFRYEPAESLPDDPSVDRRRQAVPLRGRDEQLRRHERPVLVAHPQQQLVVRAGREPRLQWLYRLAKQLEPAFLQRIADARRPLHFLAALHQVDVVFLIAVDTVPARVLRRRTGAVGGRQQRGDIVRRRRDRHDADACTEAERTLVPDELELLDQLAQRLGGTQRLVHRAAFEQHAELVSAEPRQRVAPADLRLQQRAELAQQLVAGAVAARIVDDLELVEIDVQDGVGRLARPGALQRPLEPALELAA